MPSLLLSHALGGTAAPEQRTSKRPSGKEHAVEGQAAEEQTPDEQASEASGHGVLMPFAVLLSSAQPALASPGSAPLGGAAPETSTTKPEGTFAAPKVSTTAQEAPSIAPEAPAAAHKQTGSARLRGVLHGTAPKQSARPSAPAASTLRLPARTGGASERAERAAAAPNTQVPAKTQSPSAAAPSATTPTPAQEDRPLQAARLTDAPEARARSLVVETAKLQAGKAGKAGAEDRPPAPLRTPNGKTPASAVTETAPRPASSDGDAFAPVAARTDGRTDGHTQQQQRDQQGSRGASRRQLTAGASTQEATPGSPGKTAPSFSLDLSSADAKTASSPKNTAQGAALPEPMVLDAAPPETTRAAEDKADGWIASRAEAGKSSSPARAEADAAVRRALPTAWLQNMAQGPLRSSALENGWKQLEMPLRNGDGTVVIKARREQDGMAVSVGFSEPRLQALAATHARQLQDALQAQYDAAVDFSLMDGSTFAGGSGDQADGQATDSPPTRRASSPRTASSAAVPNDAPPTGRPTSPGARREWIG